MTKRTPKPKARNSTKKRPHKRKGPKPTKKGLRTRLDQVFSWYMRLIHSDDKTGMGRCWTCDKEEHWTKLQNGHFVSRMRYATRWRPDNCRPQCYACNITRQGEQWKFGKKLNEHYGEGHAEKMFRLSERTYQPTKETYEIYIDYYEAHCAAILARRAPYNRGTDRGVPKKLEGRIRMGGSRGQDPCR